MLTKSDAARLASLTAKKDYIENELPNIVLSQLKEAYTGSGTSVDWKFDTEGSSVSFAESPDFVNPDDNVIYSVDGLYSREEQDPSNYDKTIPGYSNGSRAELGGLASYFSLGVDAKIVGSDRVYAHELGHNTGLLHPSLMYLLLNPEDIKGMGEVSFEKTFFSSGGNLMLEGNRDDGQLILEEHQILQIEKLFNSGKLNLGSNQYDSQHAKQGRGTNKSEQLEYNYTPSN